MNIYLNIREVIQRVQSLPWNASLFVDYEQWGINPEDTPIYVLTEEEALEGAGDHESQEPLLARKFGVAGFFDVVTLLRIVAACDGASIESKVLNCIDAINEELLK